MEIDKKRSRYKWILYIALLMVTAILQSTWLSHVRILGGTPQLMPFAVSVIAMLEGVSGGASAGLAAGILMDALSSPSEGFYTVIYVVCGIVVSILNAFMYRKTYVVSLLFWVVAMLVTNVFYYLSFSLTLGRAGPLALVRMIPGELVATLIFTPFIYLALRGLHRRFRPEDEQ